MHSKNHRIEVSLQVNQEFSDAVSNCSASPFEKYRIAQTAGICVRDYYPYISVQKNNTKYESISSVALCDLTRLRDIIQSSTEKLEDGRKFILGRIDRFIS